MLTSQVVAQQQEAWASAPGVPMDVSAGRTRRVQSRTDFFAARARMEAPSMGRQVCYHCRQSGHVRALCPSREQPRVQSTCPSPTLGLDGEVLHGRDARKEGNFKISPHVSQKRLRFGNDVGKCEFIKFAKKYNQQLEEECASVGRITVRAMSPPRLADIGVLLQKAEEATRD